MEQTVDPLRSRRRDEKGTSLLEFGLIVSLLSVLLFGIVVFGVLLSKRAVLTQATAEGARAAVPYQYTAVDQTDLVAAARTQVDKSLEATDRDCADGMTSCTFLVYSCGDRTALPTGSGDCLEVSVVLEVKGSNPLVPTVGFIGLFMPSTMTSTFTVTLGDQT